MDENTRGVLRIRALQEYQDGLQYEVTCEGFCMTNKQNDPAGEKTSPYKKLDPQCENTCQTHCECYNTSGEGQAWP